MRLKCIVVYPCVIFFLYYLNRAGKFKHFTYLTAGK